MEVILNKVYIKLFLNSISLIFKNIYHLKLMVQYNMVFLKFQILIYF